MRSFSMIHQIVFEALLGAVCTTHCSGVEVKKMLFSLSLHFAWGN